MDNKKLDIAFIGNGKSTNRYHLPYLLELKDLFNVKTIWKHSNKLSEWKEINDIKYTTNLENVLEDNNLDLVIVTTPAESHYKIAKKVLEAGKNCIVEKPFTLEYDQAIDLINLAKEKELLIMSYQNRRFDSDFLTVQKVIDSGILGKIFEFEMNYDYYRPEVPRSITTYKKEQSFVFTHLCHTLDQVISYFGYPESVYYDVRQLDGIHRMNDYFDLDLFYPENLKVMIRSSYKRLHPREKFKIYGEKGTFIKETEDQQEADLKKFYMPGSKGFGLDKPEQYGTLYYIDTNGNYHEEKIISEEGNYGEYYKALYDTLVNGKEPLVKPEEILNQIWILNEVVKDLK